MDERRIADRRRPLPDKIERRLAELLALGEFDQGEVAWCRRDYWGARDDWHTILVDCHARALNRDKGGAKVAGVCPNRL